VLCWGSTKGVCNETARELGLRVIRPIVLLPFPADRIRKALIGIKKVIAVEENATGQLALLAQQHGIAVQHRILQYDGRPFAPEDLLKKVKEVTV
jgi:2-oxoglutarate ferredoxin oxidoreductase subunit alpha